MKTIKTATRLLFLFCMMSVSCSWAQVISLDFSGTRTYFQNGGYAGSSTDIRTGNILYYGGAGTDKSGTNFDIAFRILETNGNQARLTDDVGAADPTTTPFGIQLLRPTAGSQAWVRFQMDFYIAGTGSVTGTGTLFNLTNVGSFSFYDIDSVTGAREVAGLRNTGAPLFLNSPTALEVAGFDTPPATLGYTYLRTSLIPDDNPSNQFDPEHTALFDYGGATLTGLEMVFGLRDVGGAAGLLGPRTISFDFQNNAAIIPEPTSAILLIFGSIFLFHRRR